MVLTYRSVTANGTPSSTTSLSVSLAPAVEGDLMVLVVTTSNTGSANTHNTPSGWTLIASTTRTFVGGAIWNRASLFYRIAGSSEPASLSPTWATANSGAQLTAVFYEDPDLVNPFHTFVSGTPNNSSTAVASAITTDSPNQLLFCQLLGVTPGGVPQSFTFPSGWTERRDVAGSACGDSLQVAQGSSGTVTFTPSATCDMAFIMAAFRSPVEGGDDLLMAQRGEF